MVPGTLKLIAKGFPWKIGEKKTSLKQIQERPIEISNGIPTT